MTSPRLIGGWLSKKNSDWSLALFGILLPALAVLIWQFTFTYINPTEQLGSSRIIFSPLEAVLSRVGGSRLHIVLRIVLSVTFPVLVNLLWWPRSCKDVSLNFSWLTFAFGFGYMYLLAETGGRSNHGNFFWSAYVTLFLLNFAAARFALLQWLDRLALKQTMFDWRSGLTGLVLLLHLLAGLQFIQLSIKDFQQAMNAAKQQSYANTLPEL